MSNNYADNKDPNAFDSTNNCERVKPTTNNHPKNNGKPNSKRRFVSWMITLLSLGLVALFSWLIFYYHPYITIDAGNISGVSITQASTEKTKVELKLKKEIGLVNKISSFTFNLEDDFVSYYQSCDLLSTKYVIDLNAFDNSGNKREIRFILVAKCLSEAGTDTYHYLIGGTKVNYKDEKFKENFIKWTHLVETIATTEKQNVFAKVLSQIFPTLLLGALLLWMMWKFSSGLSNGSDNDNNSIFKIGKATPKVARSTTKFSDVAGIIEEKEELKEIVDYLLHPGKYVEMGAHVPKGVMLYGPPGTGKTLLAKAVAGEANVAFFQTSGSNFEDMFVGVGAKRIRDLFKNAIKAQPAIIFIDEIDSVASKRSQNNAISGGSADQTINQLLSEMDGFDTRSGIVVMAATNRIDILDEAILRPGRFDRLIQVNLPDIKEREAILKIHSRNKNLSSKVSLEDIARRTPGFSGAQLENVLNEATLLAVRENNTSISVKNIDEGIDRVMAGPAKKSRVITPEEKRQIAYHEAGHALVGLYSKGGEVVEKITIIPRGMAAGYTLSSPEKQEIAIKKKSDLLAIIRTTLGGRAAETLIYGANDISTGASNDLYKVTNLVKSMVTQLGMSDVGLTQFIPSEGQVNPFSAKFFSESTNEKIDAEIEKIIQTEFKNAIDVIQQHRQELELLVETLLLLEVIVKKEIDYIHTNLKLPQEALEKKQELEKKKQTGSAEKKQAGSTEKKQVGSVDKIRDKKVKSEEKK